jgi:putative membrane protein
MTIVGAVVGLLLGALLSGLAIWVVGKLGLGLDVSGFGPAFLTALVIAVISGALTWLLNALGVTIGSGIVGAIIHLIIAAIVLMVGSSIVPGVRVRGFGGALIAAAAIAVVIWLVALVVGAVLPA